MHLRYLVAAALLSVSVSSHASTISFGSFAGSSAPGLSNGTITYSNTGGTGSVVNQTNAAYNGPLAGTSYVSYTNSNNAAANYTTTYSTSYTGNLLGDVGSLTLFVDNSASVFLNGFLIGSGTGFSTPTTFTIASSDFVNGVNTFTFNVLNDNTGGPTAFDFSATATSTAPEPSSLALLGTGIIGIAGAVKRRFS